MFKGKTHHYSHIRLLIKSNKVTLYIRTGGDFLNVLHERNGVLNMHSLLKDSTFNISNVIRLLYGQPIHCMKMKLSLLIYF